MPNGNFNCAERQLLLSQGTTLALQKDSFCSSKGLVLQSKRTRFAIQKDSFCFSKGLLLKIRWILSEKGKGKSEKSDGVAMYGILSDNNVLSGFVSGLAKQLKIL